MPRKVKAADIIGVLPDANLPGVDFPSTDFDVTGTTDKTVVIKESRIQDIVNDMGLEGGSASTADIIAVLIANGITVTPPAPTSGVVDDTANTFAFTPASGYAATVHEYSVDNGSTYSDVTVNPITGITTSIASGYFKVRVKAGTNRNAGAVLASTSAFTVPVVSNLFTVSEDFANSYWQISNPILPLLLAPDGTSTAYKSAEANVDSPSNCYLKPATDTTYTSAAQYTVSIHAKPDGRSWILIKAWDGSTDHGVYFNITTGALGTASAATGTITAAANGFYRCSITFTTAGTSGDIGFRAVASNGVNNYTGDNTSGIIWWGAQLNLGGVITYSKTP